MKHHFPPRVREQQLAEEFSNRNELQMQLDSKESDIEQLREKLNDLQQRVDNSSITSLQTDETDSNIAGSGLTALYPLKSQGALLIAVWDYRQMKIGERPDT